MPSPSALAVSSPPHMPSSVSLSFTNLPSSLLLTIAFFSLPSVLALAVQACDSFSDDLNTDGSADQKRKKELDSLYTNVRILLAGLEKYGQMWEGIATMASACSNSFFLFPLGTC